MFNPEGIDTNSFALGTFALGKTPKLQLAVLFQLVSTPNHVFGKFISVGKPSEPNAQVNSKSQELSNLLISCSSKLVNPIALKVKDPDELL